jgi:asparagine synthetase B (glutamine-hydrolysing)
MTKCDTGCFAVSGGPTQCSETPAQWRGGSFIHESGIIVSWTGRFIEIDGVRECRNDLGGSEVAERFCDGYLRSPSNFWPKVRGDFAVCIWEPTLRRLSLVSDPMGSVPLFYCIGPRGDVHFGNHAGKLARECDNSAQLDENFIVATISGLPTEVGATCIKAVRSVPSGCVSTFTANRHFKERYWRPTPLPIVSSDELVERFRERFFSRIRIALGGNLPAAVSLSGGLDSSAVFRAANRVSPTGIEAIHFQFPYDSTTDEMRYALAALEGTNVPLSVDTPSTKAPTADLLRTAFEPGLIEWFPINATAAFRAARHACRVLITGEFGDAYGGLDEGWVDQYSREGRWADIWSTLTRTKKMSQTAAATLIAKLWTYELWPSLSAPSRCIRAQFIARRSVPSFLNRTIVGKYGLCERESMVDDMWNGAKVPFATIAAHILDVSAASTNRTARLVEKMSGIPLVYPLADPEFVRIAASLPWELRHGPVGGRELERRAMTDLLPEIIRLRTTKCFFPAFYRRYIDDSLKSTLFCEGGILLEHLLNLPWAKLCREARAGHPYPTLAPIFRVGLIGAWLREQRISC